VIADVLQEFPCECAITESRGRITSVVHCDEHWDLRHEDKTLKQMATELRERLNPWKE
jgi:hypothetical protein